MDKEQYIQSLKKQGYSIVDIMRMVDEKFPETIEQPKKIEDPVKTETSMGSLTDMVSKSEDGSLESFLPDMYSTEANKNKPQEKDLNIIDQAIKKQEEEKPSKLVSKEVALPGLEEYPGLEKMLTSGELSRSELANMGLTISEEGDVEIEKIAPVEIKVEKRPSNLTEIKTFGDKFKASAISIGSDILKIPALINRSQLAFNKLFMSEEQRKRFDKMTPQAQDVYAQAVGINTAGVAASIKAKELDEEVAKIEATLPQYREGIVEDFQAGNYARGAARTFSGIGQIIPSIIEAFTPGGIPLIFAQSAAGSSETAIQEGKEIDFGLVGYSATIGASEALLELTTKKLGSSLFKSLANKPRAIIKKNLIEVSKGVAKEGGKESISEVSTEVINKLADDIYLGKDFELSESWNEFADIALLSFVTGGGIKAGANAIEISKSIAENRIVNRTLSKTNYNNISDAFVSDVSDKESISIAKNKYAENVLKNELTIKERLGEITEQESKDIQTNFNKTKTAVSISEKLGIDEELSEETVSLIKERSDINQRIQDAGENKALVSDDINRLKEVDERLAQIGVENKTLKTTKNVSKIIEGIDNVEIKTAENTEEANAIAEEQGIDKKSSFEQGYIIQDLETGKQTIVINKEIANRDQAVNVASHELLHAVLFKTVGENQEVAKVLASSLEREIEKIDPSILKESNFKDRLSRYSSEAKPEETLTLFADAVATGEIQFEESLFSKIGGAVRRVLQSVGFSKIKFNDSKDVFNFIKDYNKSVTKGRFTSAQSKLIKQTAEGQLISEPIVEASETTVKESAAAITEKPKAIFMIGGPGAGKTNIGKGLKLGRRGFKVVNQDIALEAMKEEAGLPAEESEYTAEQRSLRSKLGAEAVKAAKEKFNQYVSNKNDMVIDGTGASYNATMKKVKELEDAGFDVSMVVANTPLQTALERNRARKERSLPDKIVTKTYDQVQESLAKYKQDFGDKLYEINTENIEYGKDLPQDFIDKVYKGIGVDKRQPKYSKATVLEEINNLIPSTVKTKQDFADSRVFNKVYEATAMPGGVINNYIRSRTSSMQEAEAATDSVVDRLMAFDPEAKRADGSMVGIEGFGEFIFANTAFGKLDAKKKLFEESQRKAQETSIDESTKQIADVEEELFTQQEVGIKEKPTINPLRFTGVPENIALSKKPEGKPTFKTITKQYAGEVGEQAVGVPAKKITEPAANLGSVNEARAIQQFFFKADNLDKFVKILPEFNIALPETQIGLETLDAPKDVKGTGLGLPKRILDYFYEDFIDPTGKLTSPKGRSKGLTSQVPVKRLKPEFRGVVSKETIDKIKADIGITPKGELNILPKGELRSPIGQLLKGMVKTYSSLAANTLVRQEMGKSNFTKEDIARAAAGKQRIMLSQAKIKESKNVFMKDDSFVKSSEEFAAENKVWKAILKPLDLVLPDSKNEADVADVRNFIATKMTKVFPRSFFTGGTFANAGTSAPKRGFFFVSKEDINEVIKNSEFAKEDEDILAAVSRETYNNLESKINNKDFRKRQDQSIKGLYKIFKGFESLIKENIEDAKYVAAVLSSSSQGMAHFIRTSAPITFYSKVLDGKVEEHTLPASLVGKYLFNSMLNGTLDSDFKNIEKNYQQGLLSKVDDKKLKGFKPNGKPYNYIASTPEGWKITDNIFGRYFNENVANTNGGIDPNNIVLYNGKTIVEEYGIDAKGFRTNKSIELQKEKAFNSNKKVMFSKAKNNNELLNDLKNREKALKNAKDPKAPTKGITVFDFDDTLATSKSLVGVIMPDGETFKIDATEFARRGDALLAQGAEFDFSDFSKVIDGKPGPLISKLEKAINKFGNKDVYVLTARPANSASAIYEFLKSLGYEIPLENITGLANSSPEAKAQWMVDKAALGYNDFYFVDDAYKNVKAVQDAMSVLDVKSKERIAYKDRFEKLDKEFNDILENKTGIASEKEYSDAKAEVVGVDKGKFNFFISPSAEDFVGLLYSTLGKGKLGENQMAWYKKNLLDPYTRAMNNIASERMALAADYKALKKQLGVGPNKLRNKIKGEGFTQEQAVRIYIWNKQEMDVPGLSKTDLAEMTKYVQNNPKLQVFADQLIEITKGDGYSMPFENWMTGSITTDLLSTLQVTKRAKHLEEWQRNVDVIFSKKNLNKLEAAYGSTYRGAIENILQRMKTGKNRGYDTDSLTGRFLDWVNGSTGAIMFFNTRSAVLQTISAVNFINWSDNNIFKASAAFANQKQYWKDFKELFMSDFLKERRDNLTINVNESDIAEMANKGGVRGAIGYILQKGFLPTQFADGFAIASGGATFYRNRINTYMKEGLSEKEAKEKAFNDFRELTEESQQSSRPDRISQQQAGPLGRIVLAFANTPSQYARIIKKAALDLKNNRGDWKTNLSKIMYYSVIQGVIFNALQSALFAADFDDEEEMEEKMFKMGNSITDGILRGMGAQGAITSVVKNTTLKALEESEKSRPKYDKVVNEILRISPPVSSKVSKLQQAAREIEWNKKEMKSMGWSLENPAWIASANVLSATTNIPADRVIKKINNITYATTQDLELYERLALLGGWQKWELGIKDEKKKEKREEERESRSSSRSSSRTRATRIRLK